MYKQKAHQKNSESHQNNEDGAGKPALLVED